MSEVQPTVEYREIKGFPGYRVGNDGSVWGCLGRGGLRGSRTMTWKVLKQSPTSQGYLSVRLYVNKRGKTHHVHKIVAMAFLGPQPEGAFVLHGPNGQKDNTPGNLYYGDQLINMQDKLRDDTHSRGERCVTAKMTEKKVAEAMRLRGVGLSYREIGNYLGVTGSCISKIVTGKNWAHLTSTLPNSTALLTPLDSQLF